MKEHFSKFLINLIIALFLEVIVFNITSYRIFLGNYEKKAYTNIEIAEDNEYDPNILLEIDELNINLATVKVDFKDVDEVTEYRIYFSDETSSRYRELDSKQYIPQNEKSKYIPVYLSGKTNRIMISIDRNIYNDGKLEKIVLNEKIPFEFNFVRFVIILGLLVSISCFKNYSLFKETYSIKNLKQEQVLLLILGIFVIITLFINVNSIEPDSQKIYNKKFVKAVCNGQFYLEDEPSEKFLELENPYDDIERAFLERGKDYLWDTAYYNGRFYIYFGILPLLVFFLPYYLLTKTYLDISFVVLILSIFILILLKEVFIKIINRYFPNASFKFVINSILILYSGSLVLYANGMGRVYEMVILAGCVCILLGIFFILKSLEKDDKKYKNIFWGSIFLALSVACRPTDLLVSIIILPYLIKLLIENIKIFKENKKPLIKLILSCRNTLYCNWNVINVV